MATEVTFLRRVWGVFKVDPASAALVELLREEDLFSAAGRASSTLDREAMTRLEFQVDTTGTSRIGPSGRALAPGTRWTVIIDPACSGTLFSVLRAARDDLRIYVAGALIHTLDEHDNAAEYISAKGVDTLP